MSAAAAAGVLDAGVLLTRLDPGRRGHGRVVRMLPTHGARTFLISAVNLCEVLHHASGWSEATGADPVAFGAALGVRLHSPDLATVRLAATLAGEADLSLADRFAMATAVRTGLRLYTTDAVLALAARRRRHAVTRV